MFYVIWYTCVCMSVWSLRSYGGEISLVFCYIVPWKFSLNQCFFFQFLCNTDFITITRGFLTDFYRKYCYFLIRYDIIVDDLNHPALFSNFLFILKDCSFDKFIIKPVIKSLLKLKEGVDIYYKKYYNIYNKCSIEVTKKLRPRFGYSLQKKLKKFTEIL